MLDAPVRFTVLGPVRVLTDRGPLDVGGATARAVLASLLVRGEAGAGIEEIISSVWGSAGAATRDSAYHYISGLRKVLDRAQVGAVLESRRPRYRLLVPPTPSTGTASAGSWGRPGPTASGTSRRRRRHCCARRSNCGGASPCLTWAIGLSRCAAT